MRTNRQHISLSPLFYQGVNKAWEFILHGRFVAITNGLS